MDIEWNIMEYIGVSLCFSVAGHTRSHTRLGRAAEAVPKLLVRDGEEKSHLGLRSWSSLQTHRSAFLSKEGQCRCRGAVDNRINLDSYYKLEN